VDPEQGRGRTVATITSIPAKYSIQSLSSALPLCERCGGPQIRNKLYFLPILPSLTESQFARRREELISAASERERLSKPVS
jgi:hypothetical protein